MAADLELALLTATFDALAGAEEQLAAVLARYVVATRTELACRNVDLVWSTTHGGRYLVVEKWESTAAARAHLDHESMTDLARESVPLLARRPEIDLYETISAHDLI